MRLVLTQKHSYSQFKNQKKPNKKNPLKTKKPTTLKVKIVLVLALGCQSVKSNSESQLTVTVIREKLLQA